MRKILIALACLALAVTLTGTAQAQNAVPVVGPDDQILGKADAPVTIIEYASMTCPHCAAFARDTLPKVRSEWIDTGKAKLVFRDFPLDRLALAASVIAHCAPTGRYYSFIESFFDSQENWARAADPIAALKAIARLGGMNAETFDKCMSNVDLQQKVVDVEAKAKKDFGVDSTPTFFIESSNGSDKVVGEQSYENFDKVLTKALPKG